jgi:hypothetical protein
MKHNSRLVLTTVFAEKKWAKVTTLENN